MSIAVLVAALLVAHVSAQELIGSDLQPDEALNANDGIQSPQSDWCTTFSRWEAKGLAGYLGPFSDCPINGECDIPDVRDSYIPDDMTPVAVVRVHLLAFRADDGSDPTTTEAEIIDSMQLFNAQYAPHRISFVYTWQWVDDSQYRYGAGSDFLMKQTYAVDPEHQCNVYIIQGSGAYGVFAWDPDALTAQGGIVMGDGLWGPPSYALVHEMGHNLGLWHTHHGVSEVTQCGDCYEQADGLDADTTGDFCSETPATPINYSCNDPSGIDPCCDVPWGDTQPENYMSYGLFDPEPCWELFVDQQAGRMQCWFDTVLNSWSACPADVSGDGVVDVLDVLAVLDAWGGSGGAEDVTGDGIVDVLDLLEVLAAWGPCE